MTKLCECGCGQPTKLAKWTRHARGHVKGQPLPYLDGHYRNRDRRGDKAARWAGGRSVTSGYPTVYSPGHPRAANDRYVLEHILIAEKVLGKPLPQKAEVHHVDGTRSNNANRNLVICEDRAYHMLLHQRARALQECGHADWRQCFYCKSWDSPENLYFDGYKSRHPACFNAWHREWLQRKKAA